MTTDLTATDTAAIATAMTEAYRLAQNELATVRAELQACEEGRAASAAENRRLRKQLASGRCPDCDAIERSLALNEDPDDDEFDGLFRTANDRAVRQLNDVLDVEAGLSEILTRHEGEL